MKVVSKTIYNKIQFEAPTLPQETVTLKSEQIKNMIMNLPNIRQNLLKQCLESNTVNCYLLTIHQTFT